MTKAVCRGMDAVTQFVEKFNVRPWQCFPQRCTMP